MNEYSLQEHIANRVRYLRLLQDLTQEDLSEKAGLGINYIHNIENKRLNIKVETLEKIIKALGLSYGEFFNFAQADNHNSINRLFEEVSELPKNKQEKVLKSIQLLIDISK